MTVKLTDTFYIGRSDRYSTPENSGEALPIVYGAVTGAAYKGLWKLPCIDTANYVYCFADHEVLPFADGNAISVYIDDELVDPADYAFDESNDYESLGAIATVTFTVGVGAATHYGPGLDDMTSGGTFTGDVKTHYYVKITTAAATDKFDWSADGGVTWKATAVAITGAAQELEEGITITFGATTGHTLDDAWAFTAYPTPIGKQVTAKGSGVCMSGTTTLMTGIVDMVLDFLVTHCGFLAADVDTTASERAKQVVTTQGYIAAGVIIEDCVIWDKIIEMMGSFLGSAYVNGAGELVLSIDDGTIQYYPTILQRQDAELLDARQRLVNLINQCPYEHDYNYVTGEFDMATNAYPRRDTASVNMYGLRYPESAFQFFWCRDATTVDAVCQLIIEKLAEPLYEIEVKDHTMKRLSVDVGDHIVYSALDLYDIEGLQMANHYWKIVEVSPDFRAGTMTFRALETPYYLTEQHLADGTITADGSHKAGNCRLSVTY